MSRDYLPVITVDTIDEIIEGLYADSSSRQTNVEETESKELIHLWEHGYQLALDNFSSRLEAQATRFDVLKEHLLEQDPSTGPRVYISETDKITAQAYAATPTGEYPKNFEDSIITVGQDMPDKIVVNDVFYRKE
jgi:hypothetical protein